MEVQLKVARAAYPFSIDDKGQLVERRGGRERRVPLFHREESDRPKGPADYETGLPGPVFTESGPLLPPGRWVLLSGNFNEHGKLYVDRLAAKLDKAARVSYVCE